MRQRRGQIDALLPVNEPRWLVIRDRFSRVLESQALSPGSDLRAVMQAERNRRIKAGWLAGDIPRKCAFFFCDRENERVCVSVECYEPGPPGSPRASIRQDA
jgi:hypothetical protein